MSTLVCAIITQSLTFLPLALGISISYTVLRATDMTLDGSFVLGAGIFAKLITSGVSPVIAGLSAVMAGAFAGMMVSLIQRGGRVDPLLAGVLATFILTSVNLAIMGRPNINLLSEITLLSPAFSQSESLGWFLTAGYCFAFCGISIILISSRFGLTLRGLGDNPQQLQRLGINIELYRMIGFAFTNALAAAAGCLTAQTVGYADIGMGLGMTLTGIGAIILGQHIIRFFIYKPVSRIAIEFMACLSGVLLYFLSLNSLLRLNVNPMYLKMILGMILILFLRTAINPHKMSNAS